MLDKGEEARVYREPPTTAMQMRPCEGKEGRRSPGYSEGSEKLARLKECPHALSCPNFLTCLNRAELMP